MQLAHYLERYNVGVAEFAARIGVDTSTVYRWMGGQRVPTVDGFRRIKEATQGKVTPNDFFCEPAE